MLWSAHSACQWPAEDRAQLGCPRQPRAAALCAARTASHTVTAPHPPGYGGLHKAPGRRRIGGSGQLLSLSLRKAPGRRRDAGRARSNMEGESLCDRPAPAPMWRAALSALLTAELAQLDCPRLPSAYRLFAGRATLYADGESHSDRPAPATTWRAALSAWPVAADRAHLQADQGLQALH